MKRLTVLFLILFFGLTFFSCSIERELARDFIDKSKNMPVLLLSSDKVIFTNEKLRKIPKIETFSPYVQDSIWNANTIFLDSLDDAKLTSLIYNEIKSGLELNNFKVYTFENKSDFEKLTQNKFIINLAQLEIIEDMYVHRDEEFFFDTILYYQDIELNLVGFNFWLELKKNQNSEIKVLFKDYYISDKLNSKFLLDQISYVVSYRYKITNLRLKDIYQFSKNISDNIADRIFNYMMNDYIKANSTENLGSLKQFVYDKNSRFLYQSSEFLFQELMK